MLPITDPIAPVGTAPEDQARPLGIARMIAVNAGWLVSDRVLKLVVNFGVGIMIARYLGPDQFGLLNFGQMLLTLLLPVATFGLPDLLLREFAKGDRSPDTILATALRMRLLLAFAGLGLMVATGIIMRGRDAIALMVVVSYGLSLFPQAFDTVESRFQSLNRSRVVSTMRMIASVVFGVLRVAAILGRMDVLTFALLYSLEVVFIAGLSMYQARRHAIPVALRHYDKAIERALFTDSWPLMLRLLTISIYMRVDQLVIATLLGDRALGIYSVATRIAELWYFVPTSIVLAAMPSLTRKHSESLAAYEAAVTRLLRVLIYIAVPVAIVISLLSGIIVDTLYGPAYREAGAALAIQAWAGVFVAIGVGTNPWFINTGQIRYGLYQSLAAAIIGTGLNLFLVPRYGLVGASLSMVASYAVSAVLLNLVIPATRPLFYLQMKAFIPRWTNG